MCSLAVYSMCVCVFLCFMESTPVQQGPGPGRVAELGVTYDPSLHRLVGFVDLYRALECVLTRMCSLTYDPSLHRLVGFVDLYAVFSRTITSHINSPELGVTYIYPSP
jgi:hypothetical protein